MNSAKFMSLERMGNLHKTIEREKNWSNKGRFPKKVKELAGMEGNM